MSNKALLLDIGGVLLSNGWDCDLRKRAAAVFDFDFEHFERLHKHIYDDFERGFISFDEYLNYTVFNCRREFSRHDFRNFIFNAAIPNHAMIDAVGRAKEETGTKVFLLSNEGAELFQDRMARFPEIAAFVDGGVISCFVGLQKPDMRIYTFAIGVVQQKPSAILYIDDREKNLIPAGALGIKTHHFKETKTAEEALAAW